jgi:hypothetical protein
MVDSERASARISPRAGKFVVHLSIIAAGLGIVAFIAPHVPRSVPQKISARAGEKRIIPKPLAVAIDTTFSSNAMPTVEGNTNLPDGTVLYVSLRGPVPDCFGGCPQYAPDGRKDKMLLDGAPVVVRGGRFHAGPIWINQTGVQFPRNDGLPGLRPGAYVLAVSLSSGAPMMNQPASVRAIIGDQGENLSGPLMGGCCFGSAEMFGDKWAEQEKARVERLSRLDSELGRNIYHARWVHVRAENGSTREVDATSDKSRSTIGSVEIGRWAGHGPSTTGLLHVTNPKWELKFETSGYFIADLYRVGDNGEERVSTLGITPPGSTMPLHVAGDFYLVVKSASRWTATASARASMLSP